MSYLTKMKRMFVLQKRFVKLFFVAIFLFIFFPISTVQAQGSVTPCEGGVAGLGGPQIPDLNSDGCVDESDVSVMLSCWGFSLANAPGSCIAQSNIVLTDSMIVLETNISDGKVLGAKTIAYQVQVKTVDTARQISDFIFSFLASTTGLSSLLWVVIRGGLFV